MANTVNEKKKRAIWLKYISVIRSYGEMARFINKERIYYEVSQIFFIDAKTVGKTICGLLKDKQLQEEIKNDEDLNFLLGELEEMV